jgi:hypothetical protein
MMQHLRAQQGPFTDEECQAIVQRMWPYLDEVLTERDRDLVAQHLLECALCQSHFVFARSFLDAVRMAQGPAVDLIAVERRVLTALAAEGFEVPHSR